MEFTQTELQYAIVVILFGLLVARRLRGRPLRSGRRQLIRALLLLYGLETISQSSHGSAFHAGTVALLAILAVVSFSMGVARGATIVIYRKAGELYVRYHPVTLLLWGVTFGLRFVLVANAGWFHASKPIADASLLLMFMLSIGGEAAMLQWRSAKMKAE